MSTKLHQNRSNMHKSSVFCSTLLIIIACFAGFGFVPHAEAETNLYEIPGKGICCYEYSMALGLGVSSQHHIYFKTNDGTLHQSNGKWAGTYYKSVAPNYGQPVTKAWADFT
ncbi:hypothetical protein [Pseudoscardovia radai]|uniref:hypothetical protein n=1 Tax=Pseudoscardovia radai TaxID=987066 RepID=UPI003991B92E